jgi:hypothetical protein
MASITCIYCKNERERPSRGEHIMLESLGGTTTISDVCGGRDGCNQRFGDSIDRELLRNSPVTLHRLMLSKGQKHDQQMFYFREDHGVWLDALVRVADRQMVIPPQLYVHGGRPIVVASPEFEKERMSLLAKSVDALASSAQVINDWEQHAPARVVLQPARGRCIVRARSEQDRATLFEILRDKLPDLASRAAGGAAEAVTLALDRPLILPLGTTINDAPRCAAKMAFNFLSHYLGADVALRAEFDSVRDYIRGTKVDPVDEVATPEGEVGVTVDTRQVANWFTTGVSPSRWTMLQDTHYIVLLAHSREIGAEVGLFGGRSRFLVRFGRVTEDMAVNVQLPAVFTTPIGGGGDRVFAGAELADALTRTGWTGNRRRESDPS